MGSQRLARAALSGNLGWAAIADSVDPGSAHDTAPGSIGKTTLIGPIDISPALGPLPIVAKENNWHFS